MSGFKDRGWGMRLDCSAAFDKNGVTAWYTEQKTFCEVFFYAVSGPGRTALNERVVGPRQACDLIVETLTDLLWAEPGAY